MKSIYTFEVAKKHIALAKEELEIDFEGEVQTITAHEIGHDDEKHGEFFVVMSFDKNKEIIFTTAVEMKAIYLKSNLIEFWIRCDRIHNIRLLDADKIFNLE